jgi:hypothetical protein
MRHLVPGRFIRGGSMQSDPTAVFVTWDKQDPADAQWGAAFAHLLEQAFATLIGNRLVADEYPRVCRVDGIENLPESDALSATSVVLVVLPAPGLPFAASAAAHLERVLRRNVGASQAGWQSQAIPIARDAGSLPPVPPLDQLQGLLVRDLDSDGIAAAATAALVNASLVLAREQQGALFISYSHRDGLQLAALLQQQLRERGFRVFRDEHKDRDQQIAIPPGSVTQKAIERAILDHGFVLLLDTPAAGRSTWVREEVNVAIGNLLPILPIVFPDAAAPPGAAQPRGGRFRSLRELGRDVRATNEDDLLAKIDEIERNVVEILLSHWRSRRRLLYTAQVRFEHLQYKWQVVQAGRLHYAAEKSTVLATNARFAKRLIVGCSPYPRLVPQTIEPLRGYFDGSPDPAAGPRKSYAAAVLVHGATALSQDDLDAMTQDFDNLLVLYPHEIVEGNLP